VCVSAVQQTVAAWRTVFFIAACVYAFGTIFYGLFGSGELQPWAMPQKQEVDVQSGAGHTAVNVISGRE